jgi:hypothetical protein
LENIEITNLYIDILRILESRFRNKAGKEFDRIFRKCKDSLPFQSKEILQSLRLSKENNINLEEIYGAIPVNGSLAESRLLLIASFNQLTFLLIMEMKKKYGTGYTEEGLHDMIGLLESDELRHLDKVTIDYLKGNLSDFLNQLQVP